MKQADHATHSSRWVIRKFIAQNGLNSLDSAKLSLAGNPNFNPYDYIIIRDNILLNVGITEMWGLIIGDVGSTPYDNANSQIGVGLDATAEDPTQTGLIDGGAAFVAMESGFPVLAGQTLTFRGIFDGSTANFDWREFSVANGSPATTGINMNRKVDNQGTKAPGQTWTLDLSITLS